jgi:hypothetical protein
LAFTILVITINHRIIFVSRQEVEVMVLEEEHRRRTKNANDARMPTAGVELKQSVVDDDDRVVVDLLRPILLHRC